MGSHAGIFHELDYMSVAGSTHGEPALAHVAGSVAHHCHVHVIKMAQFDQFLFAAQELQFALLPHLKPLFDFYKFFCRNSEWND